mgnify:CR=1 FL=1
MGILNNLSKYKPALDPNTNWHNRIEGETITRPDVGSLRKEVSVRKTS